MPVVTSNLVSVGVSGGRRGRAFAPAYQQRSQNRSFQLLRLVGKWLIKDAKVSFIVKATPIAKFEEQRLDNRQELRHAFQFSCGLILSDLLAFYMHGFRSARGFGKDTINGLNFGCLE